MGTIKILTLSEQIAREMKRRKALAKLEAVCKKILRAREGKRGC